MTCISVRSCGSGAAHREAQLFEEGEGAFTVEPAVKRLPIEQLHHDVCAALGVLAGVEGLGDA